MVDARGPRMPPSGEVKRDREPPPEGWVNFRPLLDTCGTMEAATVDERPEPGELLLEWLRLLGWQVHVTHGARVEAVAVLARDGARPREVRVEGGALAAVAWQLFERAVLAAEATDGREDASVAA